MFFNPQTTHDPSPTPVLTPELFLETILRIDNDFPLDEWNDRASEELGEFRAKVINKVARKAFLCQEFFLQALKVYALEFSAIVVNPLTPDITLRKPWIVENEELWEESTLTVWKQSCLPTKRNLSNAKPHDHMAAMIELAKQAFLTDVQLNSSLDPLNLGSINPEIERMRAQREKLEKMNEESQKRLDETQEEHKRSVERLAKEHAIHEKLSPFQVRSATNPDSVLR
jgi:hypothetical protein